MSQLRSRDTAPELALRSELHRRGFRYRVDRAPVPEVRSRADLVLGPAKVAIYVDGCFWHRCPEHGTTPKTNADFWDHKLKRNQERDAEVDRLLDEQGWKVVRVWEHENAVAAADRIEDIVRSRNRQHGI